MLRHYGRSSPVKDGVGVIVMVGTALLYAFGVPGGADARSFTPCEETPAAPAATPLETPPEDGALRSATGIRKASSRRRVEPPVAERAASLIRTPPAVG